jgi:hypothetical protein
MVFQMERVSDVSDVFTVSCTSYFLWMFDHTYDLVIKIAHLIVVIDLVNEAVGMLENS